jgi:hypothetical protein
MYALSGKREWEGFVKAAVNRGESCRREVGR